MIPGINISIKNGQLGQQAQTRDGVVGLICTGLGTNASLNTPVLLTSLEDYLNLGATQTADAFVVKHVREFYNEAGNGSLLYLLLVPETQTMVQTVDSIATNGAKKLLDFAQGEIKVLGIVRNPVGETSVPTNFFRADVISAISGAQTLLANYTAQNTPLRILLGGRLDVTTNVPQDLKALTHNRLGVICGDTVSTSNNAAVGLALGRVARTAVSTSIARVKDGPLVNVENAYIGSVLSQDFAQRNVLIDKGAITITTYFQRTGYYFSDDQMCALPTDDFTNLVNGRVVDKAHRIAYQVYVQELHESVPIDPATGQISPEVAKSLEGKIEQAVTTTMANEISGFDAFVDTNQNVIATGKVTLNASITPFGYGRKYDIVLGLTNPFN